MERGKDMEKAVQYRKSEGAKARAAALAGLSLGYFMVMLDTTVVSVALPSIQNDLGGGLAGLQWVVNAYTILFAGLLLTMGTVADRAGARLLYGIGLLVFMAASAISAVVPSIGMLIAMRAVLGIGGAALMPASLALVSHTYSEPSGRARALGVWAAVSGLAMAAGPVIGGLMVDALGWRSIFWLNVPVGAISLLMTLRYINETGRKPQQGFDWKGQLLTVGAIGLLSFAVMEGNTYGWSSLPIVAAFALAFGCAFIFLAVEAKSKAPMLPLRLFGNKTVAGGMAAGVAVNIGFSGILFVMPLFFQQYRGLPAHVTGLLLLPMMIPLAINPPVTGRIVGRIGARMPMTLGFGMAAAGSLLLAWSDRLGGYVWPCVGLLLIGYGISFTIPALMAGVIAAAPKELTGTVSGALNSGRQVGAALGVALFAAVLGSSGSFVSGMLISLIAAAVVLAAGCIVSFCYIGRR